MPERVWFVTNDYDDRILRSVRPQESPHFEYGLFRGFFALTGGELRALRSHIEHGATSFSALRNPEPALQDSSYENRRRGAPTSSCILVLEKMRG